jgi:hypothetical protein
MWVKVRKVLKKMYGLPFFVFSFIGGSLSIIKNSTDQTLS